MKIRVGNFNLENLFSRYYILNLDPQTREKLETDEFKTLSMTSKTRKGQNWHQIKREPINEIAQQNTAKIIDAVNADILCLQEIEDLPTLRNFADKILEPIQKKNKHKSYSYFMLIDGNDIRGIDVAIMSRFPFGKIQTHMYDKDPVTGYPLFSRDCLDVQIIVNKQSTLNFLIQHFKSQIYRKNDPHGNKKRTRQVNRVAEIIKQKLSDDPEGDYVVVGDFNDKPKNLPLKPLFKKELGLYNTIEYLTSERWTYIHGTKKQQLDYMLINSNLKDKMKHFGIERRGLSRSRTAYKGKRLPTVQKDGTEASDHCAIFMDLEL